MRLGVAAALVDGTLLPGDVEVRDGRIAAVGASPAGHAGVAAAGFIDLQVNGFAGVDFLQADPLDYRTAGKALLNTGVTAFQPTLVTAPETSTVAALGTVAEVVRHAGEPASGEGSVVARVLPAHLEGPFLSPNRLGIHPAERRRDPDFALSDRLLAAGPVGYVTLAPELPGALALIDRLRGRGIVVSAGHSDADAGEAHAAFDHGVATVTHLFNAMRPMRPRDPGIAGAALARDDVVVQVIVDDHHLAPDAVRMVWRAAGGRLALVTDAVSAARVGDGSFLLGGVAVEVRNGAVRRADGTLAGSALTMLQAVRNLHALGVALPAALEAATVVPARVLGRDDLGRLKPGAVADVVVLDDRLELTAVAVGGVSA